MLVSEIDSNISSCKAPLTFSDPYSINGEIPPSITSSPEMVGPPANWLEPTDELSSLFHPQLQNPLMSATNDCQPLTPPDSLGSSVDFLSDSDIDQLLNDFDANVDTNLIN